MERHGFGRAVGPYKDAGVRKRDESPSDTGEEAIFSGPICLEAERHTIIGKPDPDHISTSYVERQISRCEWESKVKRDKRWKKTWLTEQEKEMKKARRKGRAFWKDQGVIPKGKREPPGGARFVSGGLPSLGKRRP